MQVPGFFRALAQTVAQILRALGARKQSIQERAQVETGSPDDDGNAFPRLDFGQHGPRLPRVLSGRDVVSGVCDIEKMMRRARAFFGARLRSADFKVAIERDRIAADDFPAEVFRENKGQGSLATRSGPKHNDQQRVVLYAQRQLQWIACQKRTSVMPSRVAAIIRTPVVSSA